MAWAQLQSPYRQNYSAANPYMDQLNDIFRGNTQGNEEIPWQSMLEQYTNPYAGMPQEYSSPYRDPYNEQFVSLQNSFNPMGLPMDTQIPYADMQYAMSPGEAVAAAQAPDAKMEPTPEEKLVNQMKRAQGEIDKLGVQFKKAYVDSMERRKAGIEEARNMQAIMRQGIQAPQLDLSPLIALAQAESGKQLAMGYNKPKDMMAQIAPIEKMRQQIQAEEKGLTNDQIQLLREQLNQARENRIANYQAGLLKVAQQKANAKNPKVDKMPMAAVKEIHNSNVALRELTNLYSEMEKNKKLIGPYMGMLSEKAANYLPVPNKYGGETIRKAAELNAKIWRVLQNVGYNMEHGVLREGDIEKYKKIMAQMKDKPETALNKVSELISLTKDSKKTYLQDLSLGGYNVDKYKTASGDSSIEQMAEAIVWLSNPKNKQDPDYNAVKNQYMNLVEE